MSKQVCKQCGLPQLKLSYGRQELKLNEEGICAFCQEYNSTPDMYQLNYEENRKQLFKVVEKTKGKNEYDAVVLFTGGKDSGYVAYLLSKVLKLKVLALTWDNGFFNEEHRSNIRALISNMEIDHKFIEVDTQVLKEFYSNRFKKLGRFCACTQPGLFFCMPEIEKSGAPIISMGVSFGQQISIIQNLLLNECDDSIRDIVKTSIFKEGTGISQLKDPGFFISIILDLISGDFSNSVISKFRSCIDSFKRVSQQERYIAILSMSYDFNHQDMLHRLKEFGWKKPSNTHEEGHTSCAMEPLKGYLCYKQNMLNLDYQELATEFRWGRFSREQFDSVKKYLHYDEKFPDETFQKFNEVTGLTMKDIEQVLEKKIFANEHVPEINEKLIAELGIEMTYDELKNNMQLAYDRYVP